MEKLKHIKKYREKPPEEGVTYDTKFATGWKFTVLEVVWKKGSKKTEVADVLQVKGLYSDTPEMDGKPFVCPLSVDRLILHKSDVIEDEHDECPKCGCHIKVEVKKKQDDTKHSIKNENGAVVPPSGKEGNGTDNGQRDDGVPTETAKPTDILPSAEPEVRRGDSVQVEHGGVKFWLRRFCDLF